MKIRGFELVSKYKDDVELLPKRETAFSAGYDLKAADTVTILPGEIKLVPTGVKAYMQPGEVLNLYDRSSNPKKMGLVLANSVGIIDRDYYNNPNNEGLMYAQFINISKSPVTVNKYDRIIQGVFTPFLTIDNDNATGERKGGFGSTGA